MKKSGGICRCWRSWSPVTGALLRRRIHMFRCDRCKAPSQVFSMSCFNTQLCCVECLLNERAHPEFPRAVAAEEAAVRRGDLNFPGIGLPPDLEPPEGGEADESR